MHLLNINGQEISNIYSGFLSKGDHTINFTKENLRVGMYMLRVNSEISSSTIEIVVK